MTAPGLGDPFEGKAAWFDRGYRETTHARIRLELVLERLLRRLPPPPRCKDWNTALVKRGRGAVTRWVNEGLASGGAASS